jgi:hypothetical protein
MKSATYPLMLVSACTCASMLAALAKQRSDVAHCTAPQLIVEHSYLARIRPLLESRFRRWVAGVERVGRHFLG